MSGRPYGGSQQGRGPGGGKGSGNGGGGAPECHKCGKIGHIARNCRESDAGGQPGGYHGQRQGGSRGNSGRGRGGSKLNPRYADKFSVRQGLFSPNDECLQAPDEAVKQKENQLISTGKEFSLSGISLDGLSIPVRPSYGTNGKHIVLRTNYFGLLAESDRLIFRYEIKISPKIESNRRKTRRLIQLLMENYSEQFKSADVATDYGTLFITSKQLPIDGDGITLLQRYYEVEDEGPRPNATEYQVKIKPRNPVSIKQLLESISSPPGITLNGFDKSETIQALNIIITQTANKTSGIYGGGKSNIFYSWPNDNDPIFNLGQGLIALKGFYTSVRSSTSRLLVNINVANAAFYPAINLLGLMNEHTPDTSRYAQSGLETFITRLKVSHKFYGKKTVKTVKGFSHPRQDDKHNHPRLGNAYSLRFKCAEKGMEGFTTVFEYFKNKYNLPLHHPKVPCINVGSNERPTFIPPELLTIEPGQQYNKRLSGDQTDEMLSFAVRKPAENARRIVEEGAGKMGLSETDQKLNAFGLQVIPKMITVNARILQSAPVLYKDWTFVRFVHNDIGPKDIATFRQFAKNAGVISTEPRPAEGVVPVNQLRYPYDGPDHRDDNEKTIERIMSTASRNGLKMLLVILPDNNAFLYSRVKFYAETRHGIHTVCSVGMKLRDKGPNYAANIAHKFNLKLGGANQTLPNDKLGICKDGKTMLVGMDVTHPSPGSLPKSPSIAAVVASIDPLYSQWPGSIRPQDHQEMIIELEEMFGERLDLWSKKNNGSLPDRIIIYRDGVSEGDYKRLLEEELPKVEAACKIRYQRKKPARYPKISVIVCGKRHHARFYPTQIEDTDGDTGQNCRNGTVVDRGITMEHGWDFFLQAHHCIQGTAKPTHYVIIRDDNKMDANALESFTHHLCYLSGRSTKAISLCPPAYFADLLCERGRMYLYKVFNAAHFDPATAPVDANGDFDLNRSPWLGSVHPAIKDSMFYI